MIFYLSEGMENCKISGKKSGKSQGILRWMISGNPAFFLNCWGAKSVFSGRNDLRRTASMKMLALFPLEGHCFSLMDIANSLLEKKKKCKVGLYHL